ncbi:hemagglutinin repeat-containing protein [Sideroxydans sp.]
MLNEVTSTNRSQLNGYTEVAGQRAEVIIANPNGITCNGCGFINTSRGVLTTGTPVMGVGGSLDAYRVTGGDIQIGASGLNGSNLDQLDLISRSLKVNGEIWANNLNAITGANQVNHTDLGVQLIAGDANKPTVGIDVALLGGMYANKITLIGTEAGVGVSSAGTLAAQAGDFSLDTQGQITLTGKTTSSGNLTLNSAAGISNSGSIDSRTNAQIKAAGEIANSGSLIAQNNLTMNGASLNSSGTLAAGIDANGNATQAGNVVISTTGASTATGTNIAGGTLTINASGINLSNSLTSAQNNLALNATAGNIDLNHAQTQSVAGNVSLTSSGMINNDYGLLSGAQITATASNLSNQGGIIGATGGVTLTSQSTVDNSAGGYIGGATVSLTANNGAVNNRGGKIEADTGLTVKSQSLDNSGGTIKNLSATDAQGNATILSITATQDIINNALNGISGFIGSNGQLTLSSATLNNNGGKLYSKNKLGLTTSGTLSNQSGFIQTDGDLNLSASGALNNQGGTIEANGTNSLFSLTAASIDNTLGGRIANSGMGLTTIDGGSQIDNDGTLGGNGNLTLNTGVLNNTAGGLAFAGNDLILGITGSVNNSSGNLYATNNLSLNQPTASLNNTSGNISSGGNITLNLASANNQNGQILAGLDNSLVANSYTGLGTVAAYGNNTISLQGGYTNAAGNTFAANGNLTLTTTGNFINQTALEAGGGLTVNAANIDNRAGALITSNISTLNAVNGNITNGGRIDGNTVETHSISFSNSNSVMGNTLNLYATNLDNSGSVAFIGATQSVNLIIANALTNQNGANIYSLGDVNIGSNVAINAGGNLSGNSVSILNQTATIEAAGNLRLAANTVTNKRTAVGVEWGPVRTGPAVTVAPGYNTQNSPSYTSTLEDQRFSAITTTAGELLAGGNMMMSGSTLNNEYSTIIAGATLTTNQMAVNNVGAAFQQREVRSGSISYLVDTFVPQSGNCGTFKWNCVFAHTVTTTATTPYSQTILSTPVGNGSQFTALQNAPSSYGAAKKSHSVSQSAVSTVAAGAGAALGAGSASQLIEPSSQAVGMPVATLPTSSLYSIHSQPSQNYLVVTDARFTSYQNFVSSDYMLSRLSMDPQQIQKRLGDGFYEQKLVNEQIMQQTGQRYLGQYATANEQYTALLDAGVSAAQDLQLVPGIALTAQQIEALQQDIVWMEERDVVLTDGSTQRVLAPQLYLSQLSKADLSPGGAIIAANDISMVTSGDINNTGVIQGRNSNILQAKNISNSGIIGSQGFTLLKAETDILNRSGQINGDTVELIAGRDILNQRTSQEILQTTQREEMQGIFGMRQPNLMSDTVSHTQLGLESSIRATNSLTLSAGRDITLTAAGLTSGGDATINAGRNLTAGVIAATTSGTTSRYAATRTEVVQLGSTIQAGGNLSMKSGADMQLTATSVDAGQNASLVAGGNLTIAAAKSSVKSSFDAGIVQQRIYDETVVGSSISAEGNITLKAGNASPATNSRSGMEGIADGEQIESGKAKEERDVAANDKEYLPGTMGNGGNINLLSSSINSKGGQVNLIASNDVTIGTTDEQHDFFQQTHVESSDLFSSSSTTTRNENHQTLAVGSDISGESVIVKAGNAADKTGNINVIGGSIVGTNDVTLDAGNDLSIKAATSTSTSSSYSHTTESGFMSNGGLSFTIGNRETTDKADSQNTLQSQNRSMIGSLNGNLNVNAGNKALISGSDLLAANDMNIAAMDITVNSGLDESTNTQSHDTKQSGLTLAITSNVTDAAQTAQQMKDAGSKSKDPRIKAMAAAAAALAVANASSQGASASVSLTYGSSQSHSDSTQTSTQTSGSTLKAGGNLNLVATGGGESSNITIQGSDINAGQDISLEADNKINLLADKNVNDQVSHNSSSSSGAGVGVTVGSGGGSFGVTANGSLARGNIDGTDTTYTNTHVNAGKALKIKSGGDTNMIGATANGQQVIADIGGDLNIESLQDTSTYDTKQQSASGSATVGFGGASASLSLNQSTINGNFASVQEQSGIKAGDGGFQIKVKGNTDLKGAVIESSQAAVDAGNNSLSTATLTSSDIDNASEYKAQSISVSGGTGGMSAPMALQASDKDTSTTRSGISGASVVITDEAKQKQLTGKDSKQTLASLNTDVTTGQDTSGAINNNLDVDQVQGAMAVTQAFVQQANTYVADLATKSDRLKAKGDAKQAAAKDEKDPAKQAQLQAEADSFYQQSADTKADSDKWAPGSTYRTIATAITAAAGGNVTGGTSQLVQSATVNYLQSLGATEVKKIADSLDSESARAALHGIVACAGAAAQGADCSSGALGASAGSALNSILQGDTSKMSAEEKENRKNLVATLVTGIAASTEASNIATATNAAVMETENNYLKPVEIDVLNAKLQDCGTDQSCKDKAVADATLLSKNNDAALQSECANNPTSSACQGHVQEALNYAGDKQETNGISKDMTTDINRSRVVVLDQTLNGGSYSAVDNIETRADFFGAMGQQTGAPWFKTAEDVSRNDLQGWKITSGDWKYPLGNAYNLGDVTTWRDVAGNQIMKNGYENFRSIYNDPNQNLYRWSVNQLVHEQTDPKLQDIHQKYIPNFNWPTKSVMEHFGKVNDILNTQDRISAGCLRMGYASNCGSAQE